MVGFLKTCEIWIGVFIFMEDVPFGKMGTAMLNSCSLVWGFKGDMSIILLFI